MGDLGSKTPLLEGHVAQPVPYLLFRVRDSVYGIHVRRVSEILLLPELMPISQRARHFIGVVNLRGRVVPVMDLELRFHRRPANYSLDDHLLVLEHEDRRAALLVNDVLGIEKVDAEQLKQGSSDSELTGSADACIDLVANINGQIVMLLEFEKIMSSPPAPDSEPGDAPAELDSLSFFASATPEAEAVFRRRSERLKQSGGGEETLEMMPLAIAEIEGEFFGFELKYVREFFEAAQITPVPCCPPQIIGNVNLRGDVLTVVNIRDRLNLPPRGPQDIGKIIVTRIDDLIVGVWVDELHGVHYLPTSELTDASTRAHAGSDPPLVAAAPYGGTMISILDLPRLMALESWMVDEEVGRG